MSSSAPATFYREPAILFGVVVPLVLFAAVVGGGYYLMGQASTTLTQNAAKYNAYMMNGKAVGVLESQVSKKIPYLDKWDELLSKETSSAFTGNLQEISDKIPSSEFLETSLDPSKSVAGLGVVTAQHSSQLKLSTRGTFRATQRALLTLETAMPQLQLQELKVDPSSTSTSLLNFQFGYTAWEK